MYYTTLAFALGRLRAPDIGALSFFRYAPKARAAQQRGILHAYAQVA